MARLPISERTTRVVRTRTELATAIAIEQGAPPIEIGRGAAVGGRRIIAQRAAAEVAAPGIEGLDRVAVGVGANVTGVGREEPGRAAPAPVLRVAEVACGAPVVTEDPRRPV